LAALETLNLDANQIGDLKPVGGLKSLQVLSVKKNRVTDLTPLTGLTAWRALYLDQNQVSDLAPLVVMVQPERQPIRGLTPFWIVSVRGNPLSAAAKSRDLPELQKRAFDVLADK
jgi:internalin A